MRRRTFIGSTASAALAALIKSRPASAAVPMAEWSGLRRKLGDRLIDINSPLIECVRNGGAGTDALFAALKNPYYLSDEPSLTQTLGWMDAWTSQPSVKGIAAESSADVAAAVDFARRNGIAPVVKGGGHSYFGNSNRVGSLLIWTHRLREVELYDAFRPTGAPPHTPPVPAVSLGAGCLWGEVYRKVCAEHGRYVQGGGCLTVGVAGLVQGGGFGSLSKRFGTGAASLVEAEVVTADGTVRIANRWRDPELFFALRGGGGGTFGVVTRLTLKTHVLPSEIGEVTLDIEAATDSGWRDLVARIVQFYADSLFNPAWGEQIRFRRGRRLHVDMVSQGLSQQDVEKIWEPFVKWVRARPRAYSFLAKPQFAVLPGRSAWDPAVLHSLPGVVGQDNRPGAPETNIYWAGDGNEAAQVLHAYQSAWLPNGLLARARQPALVDALVRAADQWTITLHTNKGLGGGSPEAIAATGETATNPAVLDAFALLICAAEEHSAYPGIPGHEPKLAEGREQAAKVAGAMTEIRRLVPTVSAYVSESDYFQKDWKRAYWGPHYSRLAAAKRRYDPNWLFKGHNCVEPR